MFVYLITDGKRHKVGIAKDVGRRLRQLQTGSSSRLHLIACSREMEPTKARFLERNLHRNLRTRRTSGEWFQLDDRLINILKAEIVG